MILCSGSKKSKENVLALINNAASKVPAKSDSKDLAKLILETLMTMKEAQVPTDYALRLLKSDIAKYF